MTAGPAGEAFPEDCLGSALGKLSTENVFNLDPSGLCVSFSFFPSKKRLLFKQRHLTVTSSHQEGDRHLPVGHLGKQRAKLPHSSW